MCKSYSYQDLKGKKDFKKVILDNQHEHELSWQITSCSCKEDISKFYLCSVIYILIISLERKK